MSNNYRFARESVSKKALNGTRLVLDFVEYFNNAWDKITSQKLFGPSRGAEIWLDYMGSECLEDFFNRVDEADLAVIMDDCLKWKEGE